MHPGLLAALGRSWRSPLNVAAPKQTTGGWGQSPRNSLIGTPPRDPLYRSAVIGFLSSIIVRKVADVIICWTRRRNLFAVGLLSNPLVLLGIATDLLPPAAITHVPAFSNFCSMAPIEPWQPAFGVPLTLAVLDDYELRRDLVQAQTCSCYSTLTLKRMLPCNWQVESRESAINELKS